MDKRTVFQCQARGCDGCVVCDREKYTLEQLEEYRKAEENIEHLCRSISTHPNT